MFDFLFSLKYYGVGRLLFNIAILLALCGIIYYPVFLICTKTLYSNTRLFRDKTLRLSQLWAVTGLMILFNIYFYFFVRQIGISNFYWKKISTYISMLPQIFVFITLIVVFTLLFKNYKKRLPR